MSNKLAFQLISRRWLHDGKLPRVISNFMQTKNMDAIPKRDDRKLIDHEVIKIDGDEIIDTDMDKYENLNPECPYDRDD